MSKRINNEPSVEEERHLVAEFFRSLQAVKLRRRQTIAQGSPDKTAPVKSSSSSGPASPTVRAAVDGPFS